MLDDSVLPHLIIHVGAIVSVIALTRYFLSRGSLSESKLPYPPGPKGLPLTGNTSDLPRNISLWGGGGRTGGRDVPFVNVSHFLGNAQLNSFAETDIMYFDIFGRNWWF